MKALALLLALASAPSSASDPARQAQRLLDALREVSGVPGLGAAVWVDGRLRWEGQSGLRDLAQRLPVQADTRFRLASVSKLFAATAAAQLHERGLLDADAPLAWHPFPSGHAGAAITPRQLAAHLSGLPHYELGDGARGGHSFADSRSAAQHWLRERRLRSAPGSAYAYSSWGYTLLGAAVEQASGQVLGDFLVQHQTGGLAIGPDRTDTDPSTHTRPYEASPAGWRMAAPHDYSYSLAGAGLSATPGALAQWGGRLLQGALLKADSLTWMTRPTHLNDGSVARHGTDAVAFGWRLRADAQGRPTWFHNGSALGARSALVLWPGVPRTAAALLSNASWVSSIDESARTLAEVFISPTAAQGGPACPAPGTRFTGHWGEQALRGTVQDLPGDAGPCARRLVLDRQPTGFDNQGAPRAAPALQLFSLYGQANVARAALVTPIGLFQLEAQPDGAWVGRVAGREWVLRR